MNRQEERDRLLAELDGGSFEETAYPYGQQDFETIIRQFENETMSPELLQYETLAVQRLSQSLVQQEDVIEYEADHFIKNLLQMEYDRVKFALCSYLRARLLKIERYAQYITQTEEQLQRLSVSERNFCTKFANLEKDALEKDNFLKNLDETLLDTGDQAVNRPNKEQFVFCVVLRDIGRVQFDEDDDDGDAVNLMKGDTYILSYDSIKRFVDDGRIKLI